MGKTLKELFGKKADCEFDLLYFERYPDSKEENFNKYYLDNSNEISTEFNIMN